MKVLHFGRYYTEHFGGTESHARVLLDCLQHHVQVANVVANETCHNTLVRRGGYDIHKVASIGDVAATTLCPGMAAYVRRLHEKEQYDIFHLHFPDPMSHLAHAFLPRHVKLVITWHSDIVRQRRLLMFYQPFVNRIVARADAIIAATPAHFSSSTQLYACQDRQRQHVVPYGIDFSRFAKSSQTMSDARQLREKFPGKKLLFALGRHVYYKGYEYLIQAMQKIADDAVLLLGGNGPKTAELKQLVRQLGLADKVIFLGRIPDGELNNGVTYVNRSGETGLVVPPRDPAALAAAINDLLADDQKRIAYGNAAFDRVSREFTLQRMTEGTLAVYRSVLGKNRQF
ncbi:MAG: glycosyltransferase [Proteobacteria bacterium]|nr:glycosyltransferase [Pseudomonadota bacterium]